MEEGCRNGDECAFAHVRVPEEPPMTFLPQARVPMRSAPAPLPSSMGPQGVAGPTTVNPEAPLHGPPSHHRQMSSGSVASSNGGGYVRMPMHSDGRVICYYFQMARGCTNPEPCRFAHVHVDMQTIVTQQQQQQQQPTQLQHRRHRSNSSNFSRSSPMDGHSPNGHSPNGHSPNGQMPARTDSS